MIDYTPPTTADLQRLKDALGYTGEQMAELASVSGGQQWRKYTGGAEPRAINMHMLFFISARLALSPEALALVGYKMREIGAGIDPANFTKTLQ
jgi:hypothetical protein